MMTQKNSNRDTTIEDIHRERQRMAENFGGDVLAILEDARKRQEASGRAVWQKPDLETASLSTNRQFLELIERSRASVRTQGGISSEEMRRRFDD